MNGMCRILDSFFGPQQLTDCPSDGWRAIQVYRDGNEIELGGPYDTEEEAEACALRECIEQRRAHSQFGVGA